MTIFKTITLKGTSGNDYLKGSDNSASYQILGLEGNDTLLGAVNNDTIYGGSGNDFLVGAGGGDYLYGELGNDEIHGKYGNDVLVGGKGNDMLYGGAGNDVVNAQNGDDQLRGGDGNDALFSGSGNDTLHGGNGNDVFVFRLDTTTAVLDSSTGRDLICDFEYGHDKIKILSNTIDSFDDLSITVKNTAGGLEYTVTPITSDPRFYSSDQIVVRGAFDYNVSRGLTASDFTFVNAQMEDWM